MDTLLTIHGEIRWLVALVTVAVALRSLLGWLRGAEVKGLDRGLTAAMTGLIDLNLVLGLILLFGLPGGMARFRMEHAGTMIVALVVAHLTMIWRRSPNAALKFRNDFFVALAVLVLVSAGVLRLRGGWIF